MAIARCWILTPIPTTSGIGVIAQFVASAVVVVVVVVESIALALGTVAAPMFGLTVQAARGLSIATVARIRNAVSPRNLDGRNMHIAAA